MTEKDLRIFFTGSYQLKQAISYLSETMDESVSLDLGEYIPNVGGCSVVPSECPNKNITFHLYKSDNADKPYQLDVTQPDSINNAPFSPNQTVIILIHGYTGHLHYSPNKEIRPAYLAHGDYNVISVDYKPLAEEGCYVHASYNTPIVGNCTAQLLDALIAAKKMSLDQLHVIGFSLGAQVASQISVFLKAGRIPRITGLDPAQPLFITAHNKNKLTPDDAEFVDVIHTNGGIKGQYGAIGIVDFYVNGGTNQPGCDDSYPDGGADSCSHARAPAYYAETIAAPEGFWGYRCCSWVTRMAGWCNPNDPPMVMGEYTPKSARGVYYVKTRETSRYAIGRAEDTCG